MKRFLAMILALSMIFAFAACGGTSESTAPESGNPAADAPGANKEVKTFRLGHSNSSQERDPDQYFATKWAEYLEEYSGGTLKIDVYGDAALGSEKDLFIMVKDDLLDLTLAGTVSVTSVYQPLQLFDLPYTVMNDEEYRALMYDDRGAYDFLREGLPRDMNMHFFGMTESGARKLWGAGEAPTSVADLAGKKIRVADSAVHRMMWTMLGYNPANVAWTEVFSAHQQKVIDGAEWPALVGNASGFYEVCDYVQSTDLYRLTKMAVINEKVWQSLTEEEQGWFTEAYWAALDDQIAMIDEDLAAATAQWEEAGCVYYDSFDKQEAYDILIPTIWDEFRDEIGGDILDKYIACVEEIRAELAAK